MKRILSIYLFISISLFTFAQKKPYWQDLNILSVNKEMQRSAFMSYDNWDDALSSKYEENKYYH